MKYKKGVHPHCVGAPLFYFHKECAIIKAMFSYTRLISFFCFLSIVLSFWCIILGVIVWSQEFLISNLVWFFMGIVFSFIGNRYAIGGAEDGNLNRTR